MNIYSACIGHAAIAFPLKTLVVVHNISSLQIQTLTFKKPITLMGLFKPVFFTKIMCLLRFSEQTILKLQRERRPTPGCFKNNIGT